jgi:hypothetical protein
MESSNNGSTYEVISPWADADPVSLRGITPRLETMTGKKIGLFCNSKRAAALMLSVAEKRLKERDSTTTTSWYDFTEVNVPEIQTKNRAKFEAWVRGVDAVILAVGD